MVGGGRKVVGENEMKRNETNLMLIMMFNICGNVSVSV